MCDPGTIIAALSATAALGGTYMQQQGRQEAIQAQDQAAAGSIRRQREYQDQAHKLFQNSLEQNTIQNVDDMAGQRTAQRAQSLLPPPGPGTGEGRAGESAAVAAAGTRGAAGARDDLQTQGMARAQLGGAGDAFRDLAVRTTPNAEGIGRIATNMQVENSLLPLSLGTAGRAGGGMREIGSIVTGLGNFGAGAAGAGWGDGAWNWLNSGNGNLATAGQVVPAVTNIGQIQ